MIVYFACLLIFDWMLLVLILLNCTLVIFVLLIFRNIYIPLSWDSVRLLGNSLIFPSLAFNFYEISSRANISCSVSNIILIIQCPENYEIPHSN